MASAGLGVQWLLVDDWTRLLAFHPDRYFVRYVRIRQSSSPLDEAVNIRRRHRQIECLTFASQAWPPFFRTHLESRVEDAAEKVMAKDVGPNFHRS